MAQERAGRCNVESHERHSDRASLARETIAGAMLAGVPVAGAVPLCPGCRAYLAGVRTWAGPSLWRSGHRTASILADRVRIAPGCGNLGPLSIVPRPGEKPGGAAVGSVAGQALSAKARIRQ